MQSSGVVFKVISTSVLTSYICDVSADREICSGVGKVMAYIRDMNQKPEKTPRTVFTSLFHFVYLIIKKSPRGKKNNNSNRIHAVF
ncbi:hypothetical protein D3Z62_24590 [Lachnospiraceae bacterium]|nr:hypothetical protein [Lachnospiraceae bacterium]